MGEQRPPAAMVLTADAAAEVAAEPHERAPYVVEGRRSEAPGHLGHVPMAAAISRQPTPASSSPGWRVERTNSTALTACLPAVGRCVRRRRGPRAARSCWRG